MLAACTLTCILRRRSWLCRRCAQRRRRHRPQELEWQSAAAAASELQAAAAGALLGEAAQQLRATAPAFHPKAVRFLEAVVAVQRVWRGRAARQQLATQQLAARRLAACTRAVAIMRRRLAVAACTRVVSNMRRRPILAACAKATIYMQQRQAMAAYNKVTGFRWCALHPHDFHLPLRKQKHMGLKIIRSECL